MNNIKVFFDEIGSVESFEKLLNEIGTSNSILIFSCYENNYNNENLGQILKQAKQKLFGGVFPQIIYKNKNYKKGNIFVVFEDDISILLLENLDNKNNITNIIDDYVIQNYETAFVFIDSFVKDISYLFEELYYNFGDKCKFIGGGAGNLDSQTEVIISNKGILKNSCIVGFVPIKSNMEVSYGLQEISDYYQVTKSKYNEIYGINYRQAIEIYKEVVEKHSGKKLTDNNFLEISKNYPIGINKINGEMIVRDIRKTEDGALICIGCVRENEYIKILYGQKEKFIENSKMISEALQDKESLSILIDGISRVEFLEDEFQLELNEIYKNHNNLIGALTIGEITNSQNEMLEFYNKTSILMVLDNE